jgi:hypothetical protein
VADYEKVIPPGQEGNVTIKIDGNKLFPGMFEKNFAVSTNDPENRQFTLTVQGTVRKVFDLSRQMSWIGFTDEDLKFEVDITNLLSSPINVKTARWGDDGSNKDLERKLGIKLETVEKGKKYRLKIWNKGELPPGKYTQGIVLATDYSKLAEKKLTVVLVVRSDVELLPDPLYFGDMVIPPGATKAFDKTFNVIAARGDSLKIVSAEPSRDDITVNIQELQPGKSFRGTVVVRPSNRIGQYTGFVKIRTNYPKCKELTLDLRGNVRVGDAAAGVYPGKK